MKKFIRIILALVVVVLLVRLCAGRLGSVIPLPGGLGKENTEESDGGWFGQKEKNAEKTSSPTVNTGDPEDMSVEDLERELGIRKDGTRTKPVNTPSMPSTTSTISTASHLSFKGIPMAGSLSAFGTELVKAGFRNAGNGTFTGDFAGYSGCKVTPSGSSSSVRGVRVDFPVISDWDALEKAYDSLQASLTRKYGIEPKTSKDNNVAVFDVPGGTITLDADVADRASWHVILTYTNALSAATTGTLGTDPIDDL